MTESEIRESQSQSEQVGVSINMPSSTSVSAETNQKNRLDPASIRTTGPEDTSMEGDDDVFLPNGNGHLYHERAAFLFNSKTPGAGARSSRLQPRPRPAARRRHRVLLVLGVVALVLVLSLGVGLYFALAGPASPSGALGRNGTAMVDSPHGSPGHATSPSTPVLQSLRAFWEPGDSRLFEARFLNGSVLTAFGHKTQDGSVASFFSVMLSDGHGSETIVRFPGRRSFASVLLANGTIVNFDWASNFNNLECKVFRKQPRRMAKRHTWDSDGAGESETGQEPLFYLQSVPLEEFSNMFRELSTVIAGTFHQGPQTPTQGGSSPGGSSSCPPKVPIRVTKCGAQYAYEAAFLQGEVRYEGEEPFVATPLPWMQETDTCGEAGGSNPPNYFLPLSRGRPTGQGAYLPYCTSTSRAFARLCSVMSHTTRQAVHAMCSSVAARVVGGSGYSAIAGLVEESCHEIYNSLRLVCLALTGHDVNPTTADPQHPVRLEAAVKDKLCSARTLVVPPLERGRVTLKVVSYCPASDPEPSNEQTMDLSIMNGSEFLQSLVHINCKGSPEVTYMYLGHAYTGALTSSLMLDRVRHRLQVCSMCAYGMTLGVKVKDDSICCNDTCAKDRKCAGHVTQPPREEKTFTEHNSVYCHDFLLDFEVQAPQLPETCLGACRSRLAVQLRMEDTERGLLHYHQTLDCLEAESSSCKKVIGT